MTLFRLSALALVMIAARGTTACSSDPANQTTSPATDAGPDTGNSIDGGADAAVEPPCADTALDLQGEQTTSKTLMRNCTYRLTGNYSVVGANVDLTIEQGVTVEAQGSFFFRMLGARLLANGTEARPITFHSSSASRSTGWQGLLLQGSQTGTKHDLHHVIVRDGASAGDADDDAAPAVYVSGGAGTTEVLFDHLTVEDSKHGGIRLYREPVKLAAGSTDIVVRKVPGYPLVADFIHGSQLPPRQSLESTKPTRQRILMFGGNDGTLAGDHVWAPQKVPFEVAVDMDLGAVGKPASLTITPPAIILMRGIADFRTTYGKLVMKSTASDKIVVDWAEENVYWGSFIFTANNQTSVAHTSMLDGVTFKHGAKNEPMVYVLGPGGPGSLGDCTPGPTVTGCTFSDGMSGGAAFCLVAIDHSTAYETLNTFTAPCAAQRKCD